MQLEFEVRDYECDLQGIVNNAVYLQYLEHSRHKFLQSKNIDFVELSKKGKNLVVHEAKYKYHKSLKPDDKFVVKTSMRLDGHIKLVFEQKIFKNSDLILTAEITGVCVDPSSNKIFKITEVVNASSLESL